MTKGKRIWDPEKIKQNSYRMPEIVKENKRRYLERQEFLKKTFGKIAEDFRKQREALKKRYS